MDSYKYSTKTEGEKLAKAVGRSLRISSKMSMEICSHIRGKRALEAANFLKDVAEKKKAVPLKRFNGDIGHKTGTGPGRYPFKASVEIMKVLNNAIANAQFKGLNRESLVITHTCAHKGASNMRYGRHRGRSAKRTHVEVVLEEKGKKK